MLFQICIDGQNEEELYEAGGLEEALRDILECDGITVSEYKEVVR